MHPMELLGDVAHVEFHFSLSLEIVLVSVQDRCMGCAKRTTQKLFLSHPMELLGVEA
jgi:hypothetical protein